MEHVSLQNKVVFIFVRMKSIVKIVKKSVDYDQKCFILTEDEKNKRIKNKELNRYIFFDYEIRKIIFI